jgi:arylformamidase
MDTEWIDISVPLKTGMVHWPDNPPVRISHALDIAKGDGATVSTISMGSHTGTHMDAPVHFLQSGSGIDKLPMSVAIGRARVIQIEDPASIKPGELVPHKIKKGERVLFKTSNSDRCWQTDSFVQDFVHLSAEGAKFLADRGIKMVGIDYLSIGGYKADGAETHRYLLQAGIWIIEGLNLSGVDPGEYVLICLPLKIDGGDGAPARAVLKASKHSGVKGGNADLTADKQ